MEERTTHADGRTHLTLFTYDPEQQCYRGWWFHSTGDTAEASGKWDAEAQTLTWTSVHPDKDGIKTTAHWKFENDTSFVWTVEGQTVDDTMVFRMKGKAVRSASTLAAEGINP